jgi:hypothetical protein
MKCRMLMIIIATAASFPVFADDQPVKRSQEPYYPRLAEIMGATQLRHFKLWYAGRFSNWDLAKYELGQIEASIQDAARYFPNIPAADMTTMTEQVKELRTAIEAKAVIAFRNFTSACNSCHQSAGVGFIVIRVTDDVADRDLTI